MREEDGTLEKIVSLLWKPADQPRQSFADGLLKRAAPRLLELGARKLKVCVEDEEVEGDALRMNPEGPPKAGMVSYWVECAQDRGPLEQVLTEASVALASFLVAESQPVVNTKHLAKSGERTPGMSQITCVVPKQDLRYEEFIRIWQTEQLPCAIETQSTFQYVRNEIVRTLEGETPPWAAVVEESFPIEAMGDPRVFYDAVDDEAKFRANLKRMIETVQRFLEIGQTDVTITSEYIFER
jgi:hypothetical protein